MEASSAFVCMVVLRNTGCGVEEHRVWRGAPCLWIRPLRKSDPRPAAGADPATRRRAHEPGAERRRQRSTMEEARFTIKLSGSLVQCSWFAEAAVSADIYELSMRCDVCSPCTLAIGARSLTTSRRGHSPLVPMKCACAQMQPLFRGEARLYTLEGHAQWCGAISACASCVVWDRSRVPSLCGKLFCACYRCMRWEGWNGARREKSKEERGHDTRGMPACV
jgi:hypothetical protein